MKYNDESRSLSQSRSPNQSPFCSPSPIDYEEMEDKYKELSLWNKFKLLFCSGYEYRDEVGITLKFKTMKGVDYLVSIKYELI